MPDNFKEMVNIQLKMSADDLGRYLTDFQFLADQHEINGKCLGKEMLDKNKLYQFLTKLYFNTECGKEQEELQKKMLKNYITEKENLH